MTKYTKGRAEAERWDDPETDPRWIIRLNNEIRFQTVGDNDEANAKEFTRRWNAFEEDGLVDKLVRELKTNDNWLHRLSKSCVILLDDGEVTKRAVEKQSRYNQEALAEARDVPLKENKK